MGRYLFGECPICRQGQLLAVKPQASDLIVMCDDCESQWKDPQGAQSFEKALNVEVHNVREATTSEVEAAGWGTFAVG